MLAIVYAAAVHALPGTLLLIKLSALIGVAFPLLAGVIKQDRFSAKTNTWLCVILAVVAALITTAAQGKLVFGDVAGSFLTIYTVAASFYHGLYKPTGIEPAIQTATSLKSNKK